MKEDYDSLRKRYADLIASHSGTVNKLELSQEEVNRVKKLYDEALQETSNAIRERNGLKQQCTAAIRQWDSALRELNEYKEALGKVNIQTFNIYQLVRVCIFCYLSLCISKFYNFVLILYSVKRCNNSMKKQ